MTLSQSPFRSPSHTQVWSQVQDTDQVHFTHTPVSQYGQYQSEGKATTGPGPVVTLFHVPRCYGRPWGWCHFSVVSPLTVLLCHVQGRLVTSNLWRRASQDRLPPSLFISSPKVSHAPSIATYRGHTHACKHAHTPRSINTHTRSQTRTRSQMLNCSGSALYI